MNFGDICASSYANVGVVGGVDIPVSTDTSRDIIFCLLSNKVQLPLMFNGRFSMRRLSIQKTFKEKAFT